MKKIYFILLVCLIHLTTTGQNLPLAAVYSGADSTGISITGMTPATDSAYVMLCQATDKNLVLVKIDESFNVLWSKKYFFESEMMHFMKIIQTFDSSLVISGHNISGNTYILKLNKDGEFIWSKSFSTYDAFRTNVVETSDHGFMVLSHGNDIDLTATGTFVVKFSSQGDKLWGKKIAGYYSFTADAMANTPDNQTLIGGNGTTDNTTFYPRIFSLAADGNLVWSKQLVSQNSQIKIFSMTIQDSVVVILTNRGIFHTDFYGNMIWSKNQSEVEFFAKDFLPPVINPEPDGGCIYPVPNPYGLYGPDGQVVKINPSGDLVFNKYVIMSIVGAEKDFHQGHLVYGNGPMPGWPENFVSRQVGICRIDEQGQVPPCMHSMAGGLTPSDETFEQQYLTITNYAPLVSDASVTVQPFVVNTKFECVDVLDVPDQTREKSLSVTPNPVIEHSVITIDGFSGKEQFISLYNCTGKVILKDGISGNTYFLNKGSLKSGIYLLSVTDDSGKRVSGKLVIL